MRDRPSKSVVACQLGLLVFLGSSIRAQTPSQTVPLPHLVVEDADGKLVGPVISAFFSERVAPANPEGWVAVALLKHGACNIPVEVRPEWLHTGFEPMFTSGDCTGPAMILPAEVPDQNSHWTNLDCGFFVFNKNWEIYEFNFLALRYNVIPNSALAADGTCVAIYVSPPGVAVIDGVYDGQMSLKTPFAVR